MKKIFPVSILVVAVIVRVAYYLYFPGVQSRTITWDTPEYYQYGISMLKKGVFVHEWRPPIYAIFLHVPAILSGNSPFEIYSPNFFRSMNIIVFIQHFISILTLLILYRLLLRIGWSRVNGFLFSVFIAFNIFLFFQDQMIMSESLAISLVTITVFIAIKTLKEPAVKNFCAAAFFVPVRIPAPVSLLVFAVFSSADHLHLSTLQKNIDSVRGYLVHLLSIC